MPIIQNTRDPRIARLENLFVIILVLILITVALHTIPPLAEKAERVHVLNTIGTLRSALSIEVSARVVKQGFASIANLAGSNPMDMLTPPPGNYLGAFKHPDPVSVSPGHWYFDKQNGFLVYKISHPSHFHSSLSGPARIRFHIVLSYKDVNHNGRYDPGTDVLLGVDIRSPDHYDWNTAG